MPPTQTARGPGCIRIFAGMVAAILLLTLPLTGSMAAAEDSDALEWAVKATYLYKIGPFVTWPDRAFATPTSPFALCILGDSPINALALQVVNGQQLAGRSLIVSPIQSVSPAPSCQILYLAAADRSVLSQNLTVLRGLPILTVTDGVTDPESKGIVNFVILGDRVRFEIDEAQAALSGLVISSKLLNLATNNRPQP